MAKKRLYDREDIAEATVKDLAQMDRRDFIVAASHIQIGIQQIWEDCEISKEVASEIIMPLFCIFNESHPYEEVEFKDTLEVIKVMRIELGDVE